MRGRPFPEDVRTAAARMVADRVPQSRSTWAAVEAVADHLGLHPNTVRSWYRRHQGVTDARPLMPHEQNAEINRLRAELAAAQQLLSALVDTAHPIPRSAAAVGEATTTRSAP